MGSLHPDHILVGLDLDPGGNDLSPGAKLASAQAETLAVKLAARITLVHASRGDEHVDRVEGGRILRTEPGMSTRARQALEREAERLRSQGLSVELTIDEGRPAHRALCERARPSDRDLVLTSKRSIGRFDLDERRLGAVALELLRNCRCPVWTAKQGSQHAPRRILAATDLSDDVGRRVVEHACHYRELFDAELHVLHACSLTMGEALLGGASDAQLADHRRRAQRLVDELCADQPRERVSLHTPAADPLAAVCDAASEHDVDLVVMGTLSRRGVSGLLIGNTAERVVTRLDRSLLTIKPADFGTPG